MNNKVAAPLIIKRKKVISGDGHHGGAWKVAYADFVTAMMAFFMLMWLLNATTEKQRKGLADYFDPTIPVVRISGGGHGVFSGDSVLTEETLVGSGDSRDASASVEEDQIINEIHQGLEKRVNDIYGQDVSKENMVVTITDEGLRITIHDVSNQTLFENQGFEPSSLLVNIVNVVADVFDILGNKIAVAGHVSMQPIVLLENQNWHISIQRAQVVRELLENGGVDAERISRVTGWADRVPSEISPVSIENNRIEITLLK